MKKHLTIESGYTLVEVLVAISILLIALIGPITISFKSLQSSVYAREQATAQFLAQEGIEMVKAIRNDAYIEAVHNLSTDPTALDHAWDWADVPNPKINECFGGSGCNIVVVPTDVTKQMLDLIDVEKCNPVSKCQLHFDEGNDRARYTMDGSDPDSPYTRVIKLEPTYDSSSHDIGVIITSTVTWKSSLFATESKVELTGAVSRIYE